MMRLGFSRIVLASASLILPVSAISAEAICSIDINSAKESRNAGFVEYNGWLISPRTKLILTQIDFNDALIKISNLEAKVSKAQLDFNDALIKISNLEAKVSKAQLDFNDALMKIKNLEADLLFANETLDAVYSSRSWRFTQPLRHLSGWIQK